MNETPQGDGGETGVGHQRPLWGGLLELRMENGSKELVMPNAQVRAFPALDQQGP